MKVRNQATFILNHLVGQPSLQTTLDRRACSDK